MNRQTLRKHLRDYYEAQSLSDAAMGRLLETVESGAPRRLRPGQGVASHGDGRGGGGWLSRRAFVGMAALLVGGVAVGLWVGLPRRVETDLPRQIAREVALNHRKGFAPEVRAASFTELGAAMAKLDFQPLRPTKPGFDGLRLVGGRYCSIGDCIAVQATVTMPDGRRGTLYEVRPDARLARIGDAEFNIDGLRVRLWREGGLLLVLAEP